MVELGPVQYERNKQLAERVIDKSGGTFDGRRVAPISKPCWRVLETGRNRFPPGPTRWRLPSAPLGDKGVILYENDLPDHYP
jgi:hypothetical protein